MKKIISLTLLLAAGIGFTACVNEEDDLFDKTAAERLNEASALYSSRLLPTARAISCCAASTKTIRWWYR